MKSYCSKRVKYAMKMLMVRPREKAVSGRSLSSLYDYLPQKILEAEASTRHGSTAESLSPMPAPGVRTWPCLLVELKRLARTAVFLWRTLSTEYSAGVAKTPALEKTQVFGQ